MKLRIHRFLPATRTEGPGVRACVWVQGCPIRCSGCAVPNTWPEEGGEEIDVQDLAERILNGPSVEGVTFAGGEPFAQAEGLAHLGKMLRNRGLSIVTYTGYVLEQIRRSSRTDWHDLLAVTDVLIDGPFRADLRDVSRLWVGSSNQRVHFLTSRYRYWEARLRSTPNRMEVRIQPDGRIDVNGLVDLERVESWFAELARLESGSDSAIKGKWNEGADDGDA
ncbi:MAG: 4Fe-4S single cluster domain-containing protein [Planifilum fimeticola]